jgi:hypothetical protein
MNLNEREEAALRTIWGMLLSGPKRVKDFWRDLEDDGIDIRVSKNPNVRWTIVARPLAHLLKIGKIRRISRGLYELESSARGHPPW